MLLPPPPQLAREGLFENIFFIKPLQNPFVEANILFVVLDNRLRKNIVRNSELLSLLITLDIKTRAESGHKIPQVGSGPMPAQVFDIDGPGYHTFSRAVDAGRHISRKINEVGISALLMLWPRAVYKFSMSRRSQVQ